MSWTYLPKLGRVIHCHFVSNLKWSWILHFQKYTKRRGSIRALQEELKSSFCVLRFSSPGMRGAQSCQSKYTIANYNERKFCNDNHYILSGHENESTVIDLCPDIFQMACGYFSFFINHYLFPFPFKLQTRFIAIYICIIKVVVSKAKRNSDKKF